MHFPFFVSYLSHGKIRFKDEKKIAKLCGSVCQMAWLCKVALNNLNKNHLYVALDDYHQGVKILFCLTFEKKKITFQIWRAKYGTILQSICPIKYFSRCFSCFLQVFQLIHEINVVAQKTSPYQVLLILQYRDFA